MGEIRDGLIALLVLAGLVAIAAFVERWSGSSPVVAPGEAEIRVIDGDSLTIGDSEIRLQGIDAPEYRQTCRDEDGRDWPCGREARSALAELAEAADFMCLRVERDRYGRDIATCSARNIQDVGAELVRRGWAVSLSDREYGGDYVAEESLAAREKLGIWRGSFVHPAAWRERDQRPAR